MSQEERREIIIVGSGFAGICMAIRLKQAGFNDFVILEEAEDLGGTWRDNTYPGCACDIPSHLYCFSFYPNPDWSRRYSGHAEIRAYLKNCSEHFGLGPHYRFGERINEAVWHDHTGEWAVQSASGKSWRGRFLATGTGGLSDPSIPDIPGKDEFAGPSFHTQRWDHSVDLRGKRLAVIGTGASAIQIVPAVVDQVARLSLFQRTPPWVMPRNDRAYSEAEKRRFRKWPFLQRLHRGLIYWKAEARYIGMKGWKPLLSVAEAIGRRHIRKAIGDREMQQALTPDYRIGCKRGLLSDDYFHALAKPQAELVTTGIDRIAAEGVYTRDGKLHEADVLVFATGFKAVEYLSRIRIAGREGKELNEMWNQTGGEAYLGTSVHGFPNLFTLTGPNTGLGHNSMVYMIESQVAYVVDAIRNLQEQGSWVEVKPEVQSAYNLRLQQKMKHTVWQNGGCKSWYQMESGKNTTLWPGWTFAYRRRTKRFNLGDYRKGLASRSLASAE